MAYELGNIAFDNGDFEKAIHYYEEDLKNNPLDINTLTNLSMAYFEIEEFDKAIKCSNSILKIDNNNIHANHNFGNYYHYIGDYDKAINYFTKLIEINPKDSTSFFNRANAYDKLGLAEKANNDRKTYANLEGKESSSTYFEINTNDEVTDKLLDDFLIALKNKKGNDDYLAYFELGNAYIRILAYGKAIDCFSEAIKLYPSDFYEVAFFNRASAYFDTEQYDKSMKDVEFYLKHNINNELLNRLHRELVLKIYSD